MEWNQAEFEKGCERFRGRYPDFKSFEEPGDRYTQEQRRHKDELIELYKYEIRRDSRGDAEQFAWGLIQILETHLESLGGPQTFISTGTVNEIRRLPKEERVKFGKLFQGVVQHAESAEDVANAMPEHVEIASSIRTAKNEDFKPYVIRTLVDLVLMLHEPDRFMYFAFLDRYDLRSLLTDNRPLDNSFPMAKEDFLSCSELSARIRRALDDADFRPKDMVDVHSFSCVILKPAWYQANFDLECERFKNRYKGFVSFGNPGEVYTARVCKFKNELVEMYIRELEPMLDKDGWAFYQNYHEILERKLDAYRPESWEGWRVHPANKIPDDKQGHFGGILQGLLSKSIFDKGVAPLTTLTMVFSLYGNSSSRLLGNEGSMPSIARVHATLLLMLARPDHFLHATSAVWNSVGRSLRGEPIIESNAVISGEIVQVCQELADDVRDALEDKGFRPRGMNDVQSFLWSIHNPDGMPKPPASEIFKRIQAEEMRIDEVTLKRYIHSLDTRGFLILAGPSGIGKTWLTRLYATAIGAEYHLVAVAKNWDKDEDMLGYVDPRDGQFHATTLLQFVDQAAREWDEWGPQAREFHLVLDEMNPTRIEHYFSLFLSLMKMRRGNEVPKTHLSGDRLVRVSPNLKFIGTVNTDETTREFADKVIDRAQLLELSIDFKSAKEHIQQRHGDSACTDVLLNLWKAMEPARPVGFRILDDIADYIERSERDFTHWKVALDQQIVSKLLPKLRGADPEVAEALRNVRKVVDEEYPLARDKSEIMWRRYEATDVVSYF